MSIDIEAICRLTPEPLRLARVGGIAMRSMLGAQNVDVRLEPDEAPWRFWWGSAASALVVPLEPGRHEFGTYWVLSVSPDERAAGLPLLFAIVLAASAAVEFDGDVFDEQSLMGGGRIDPGALLARPFDRSPVQILRLLGVTHRVLADLGVTD